VKSTRNRLGRATGKHRTLSALVGAIILAASSTGAVESANAADDAPVQIDSSSAASVDRPSNATSKVQAQKMLAQTEIAKIVDANRDKFGGYYADGYSVVNIATAEGVPEDVVQPLLSSIIDIAKSADIKINRRSVLRTYAELQSIADAVRPDASSPAIGVGVTGTEIDVATNTVIVYTNSDVTQLINRAKSRYADTIQIRKGDIGVDLSRTDDNLPFRGGDYISANVNLGPSSTRCTTGFSIRNAYGQDYMLTAGHCFEAGSIPGYRFSNGYRPMGLVAFKKYPDRGNLDNALLGESVDGVRMRYSAFIWTGPPAGQSGQTSIGVSRDAVSCINCHVYFNGGVTGQKLATLTGNPFCRQFPSGYSCGLQKVTSGSMCEGGDSGGPVFAYGTDGYALAVGIIKGKSEGKCVYTQIQPILTDWVAKMTPLPF
jgi:hypothetical protein